MIGNLKYYDTTPDAGSSASTLSCNKILVVDGDERLRTTIRLALTQQGYQVDVAPTVANAYSRQLEHYTMFIIDMKMDQMAGLDLAVKLRNSLCKGRAPLIIFCSTKDSERDIIKGLDAGADDYIPRSFNMPTLLARVNALMRRHKRHTTVC